MRFIELSFSQKFSCRKLTERHGLGQKWPFPKDKKIFFFMCIFSLVIPFLIKICCRRKIINSNGISKQKNRRGNPPEKKLLVRDELTNIS